MATKEFTVRKTTNNDWVNNLGSQSTFNETIDTRKCVSTKNRNTFLTWKNANKKENHVYVVTISSFVSQEK